MLEIVIATRKYEKEVYTYVLEIPAYHGETGCLGIELSPKLKVITPENWCGYEDYFMYDDLKKSGYFLHRYHPAWIRRKIVETCNRLFNQYVGMFQFPGCEDSHGLYKREILRNLGYKETFANYYEKA